jgi:hypothetical protein
MFVNERHARRDVRAGALMEGGRWIAGAGFAYVAAWLLGLAIGLTTSSPAPTDAIQKIEAYLRAHREAAMIQAYFLDGLAGAALIVFAAGGGRAHLLLRRARRRGELPVGREQLHRQAGRLRAVHRSRAKAEE